MTTCTRLPKEFKAHGKGGAIMVDVMQVQAIEERYALGGGEWCVLTMRGGAQIPVWGKLGDVSSRVWG